MRYTFRLLNHLGEPHEAHELICDGDDHAVACGCELLHRGYPVEVMQEDRRVRVLKPVVVILDDFVRHLLGRRPLLAQQVPSHREREGEHTDDTQSKGGATLRFPLPSGSSSECGP